MKIVEFIEVWVERCQITQWLNQKVIRIFISLLLIVLISWIIGLLGVCIFDFSAQDVFCALAALYAGLAFIGMICSVRLQNQEMNSRLGELEELRKDKLRGILHNQVQICDNQLDDYARESQKLTASYEEAPQQEQDRISSELKSLRQKQKRTEFQKGKIKSLLDQLSDDLSGDELYGYMPEDNDD